MSAWGLMSGDIVVGDLQLHGILPFALKLQHPEEASVVLHMQVLGVHEKVEDEVEMYQKQLSQVFVEQ